MTRLPADLLTDIFAMLSDDEVSALYSGSDRDNYRDLFRPDTKMHWVRLMLVCRHWYDIGQSSPWLWRRISITGDLKSLEYRLSRTIGCTIDVIFSEEGSVNDSAMSLLIPFAPHIRSLETPEDFRFDVLPSIKPLFQVALRALESIKVLPYPAIRGSPYRGDSEQWFDLGLSGELHPRLRRLQVHRIVIPHPPAFFSTLRVLIIDLKDLKVSSGHQPLSPEHIVSILAHAQHLEALEVSGSDFVWRYPSDPTPPAILEPATAVRYRLPCLRRVVLICPYLFAASILYAIDAPALAVFHVQISASTPIVLAELGTLIFPPSLRYVIEQCTQIFVSRTDRTGFKICDAKRPHNNDNYQRNRLRLEVTDNTHTEDSLNAALFTLFDTFGVASQIRSLVFADFGHSPSHRLWNPVHTTFPALRSVNLRACSPAVVVDFLWKFRALSKEGVWSTVCELDISTGADWMPNSLGVHVMADLLLATARIRAESGVPLASVRLEHDAAMSTPLGAHRWTLWAIHLACKHFDFRIYYPRDPIPYRLDALFTLAEWKRLLDGSWDGSGASDQAAGVATPTVDVDNLGDDESSRDEHVTSIQSTVLKELQEVVPVSG